MSLSQSIPLNHIDNEILQLPWTPIKSANQSLLEEMLRMYWNGVLRELEGMILDLSIWQMSRLSSIVLEEEKDEGVVSGYETFLEQVSESSRAFAVRYAERKTRSRSGPIHLQARQERLKDLVAQKKSLSLRNAVNESLETLHTKKTATLLQQRARLLLQGAGFLDIDKLVQHRQPLKRHNFWKQPRTPQLALQGFDSYWMPVFIPKLCIHCGEVIRGIMFQCVEERCKEFRKKDIGSAICEDCYYSSAHPRKHLIKQYKHSILRETLTPEISRKICGCSTVPRIDKNGASQVLFPVDPNVSHRGSPNKGTIKCGLLTLNERVAEAKYESQLSLSEKQKDLEKIRKEGEGDDGFMVKSMNTKSTAIQLNYDGGALYDEYEDEDIPSHIKRYTDRYPFGNVHVSLTIGPLIIENGAKNSNDGVLITSRDPPQCQSSRDYDREIEYSLSLSPERKLYSQYRTPRVPRRLKACMKQVVGGAFSGFFNEALEQEAVNILVRESQTYRSDPRKSSKYNQGQLKAAAERVLVTVRNVIESRVRLYLGTIVKKLLNESVALQWDKKSNNCQKFCESIIDYEMFSSLVCRGTYEAEPTIATNNLPLYLMSFVCRPGGYTLEKVKSKYDVPNGLTEEYILKFRFGRHDDADIFDTLQEFWHDWGAFGGHLYKYQDLFPWDCTEAYSRYPIYCNACSLSKHVWSFPFDSWSVIQLHLHKDRHLYPPSGKDPNLRLLSDEEWMRNRLTVLLAQDKLIQGAKGMALTPEFRRATAWLHEQSEARIDRVRLGGIHRAQPYSHQYERGVYHEYYIAEWAHLDQAEQIKAYESMRNKRAALPDIPQPQKKGTSSGSSHSGSGGGPDFIAWYGFDLALGGQCGYVGDGWDGSYPDDGYCAFGSDGINSTVSCGANGGASVCGGGGGLSCGGGGGCGGGGCGGC